ncbi:MAG: serine/threonine protein kinase, partial [Planctomycetaceae bacterium]
MSERKFGPFVVGEQIGVGGMGVVYRAVHPETGKAAALKLLPPGLDADPKMQQRFEREIGILKRLQHPNIVRYYGGGFQGGQRWYAMEFIDGGSLQDVLKRRGRLTPLQAVQAGRQLCAALEHAH